VVEPTDKTEKTVDSKTAMPIIISAMIGLVVVGVSTMMRENASNTANLPATNANVAANA